MKFIRHRCFSHGFTMLELLTTIVIIGVLVTGLVYYIVNYSSFTQQSADNSSLLTLNQALEQYKLYGGMVVSNTLGGANTPAKVNAVITALKNGFAIQGQVAHFIPPNMAINTAGMAMGGTGFNCIFTQYNTYSASIPSGTLGTITNGLIGWWKLNANTSGNIANGTTAGFQDSSGQGYNATAVNSNGTGMAWVPGRSGGAVSFDGVDDNVTLPSMFSQYVAPAVGTPAASMSSFTISAWANRVQTVNAQNIIFGIKGANTGIQEGYFGLWGNDGGHYVSYSTSLNTWYQAVMTYDNQTQIAKCYINGSLVGSINMSGLTFIAKVSNLSIGSREGGLQWWFHGLISDVRIYNRALSATEVVAIYNGQ